MGRQEALQCHQHCGWPRWPGTVIPTSTWPLSSGTNGHSTHRLPSHPDFRYRPPLEEETCSQAGSTEALKSPVLPARCTSSFARQVFQCLGQTNSGIPHTTAIAVPYLSLLSPSLPRSSENSRSSPWRLQRGRVLACAP